jgi:hypothetical protein
MNARYGWAFQTRPNIPRGAPFMPNRRRKAVRRQAQREARCCRCGRNIERAAMGAGDFGGAVEARVHA